MSETEIIKVQSGDVDTCRQAAALHIAEIHSGLLPLLGASFLTRFYLSLADAPHASIWIARDDARVVGFLAGCVNVTVVYKHVFRHCGLSLGFAAGLALLRPSVVRRVPAILVYPFRRKRSAAAVSRLDTEAELLAIAVTPHVRGRGVGHALVLAFENFLRASRVTGYRVATNIEERPSNAFYRALGFLPIGTTLHHDLTLQLYEKNLPAAATQA
jgi:ribosomal protein S18 acetylase RimI-like enzyme